jgi:glycosyltransferase involved in cell wall biosynthesis
VRHRIRRDILADYFEVARSLNRSGVGVVSVQHEYGIWGGDDGGFVLNFVGALTKPVVTTLHTVPQSPSARQRAILVGLINASAASVVMSQSAARLLTRVYGIAPNRLDVVPHGVPSLPLVAPDTIKPGLGLAPGPVILSFGLLGPGKGYETVIEAMPSVIDVDPAARMWFWEPRTRSCYVARAKPTEPSSCVSPTLWASPRMCCSWIGT